VAVPTEAARDSARGSCRWGLPAPADLTFKQTTFDQTFLLNPAGVDARMYRQFHHDRRYTGDVSRNLSRYDDRHKYLEIIEIMPAAATGTSESWTR